MPQYTYIKIALIEQNQQSSTTLIEYSPDGSGFTGDIPVPSAIFDCFLNARECFVQWTTREANYFALIFRNPFSTDRTGFYMVTMCVKAGAALTGRETLRALTSLRKTLVEEKRMTPAAIEETIASCGIPAEPRSFDAWRIAPTYVRNAEAQPCYRSYVSTHELENYLTFPIQEEYEKYSCVIYVTATTSLRPGVEIQHVITPLRNIYSVITPAGVESSRPSVAAGDRIVITYSRQGYSPVREAVVAGKPSAFVTYDGARMLVRPESECQILFTRRIPLTVRSAKGGPVTGYTVTVNGRPVDTMQPYIEISDQDIKSGSPVVVTVNSNNFISEKIELKPEECTPDHPLSVMLNPLEQGITLRLDFGEGRVFEEQISLEKNTPEYSQLHGGSFHGFRARRLTIPGGGEIYYIDVRSGAKPCAPAFDNISSDGRPAAPRFDRSLPRVESETEQEPEESESEHRSRRRRRRRRNNILGIAIGIVLVAAMITGAVFFLFPSWFDKAENREAALNDTAADTVTTVIRDTVVTAVAADQVVQPEATEAPAQTVQSDYRYLNESRTWSRDSMTTDTERALYDAIAAGDIERIVRNPYFFDGKASNADAVKVADIIWASFGSDTQKSNEKVLRDFAKTGNIDLHEMYEKLAHYRSREPNKTPRPTK